MGVETAKKPTGDIAVRLADGDPDAPRLFVEAYYSELFRYARAMVKDVAVAEDVLHDAFVRALEALGKYDAERVRAMNLRAWMYRIVLNGVRDVRRGKSRRGEVELTVEAALAEPRCDHDTVMDVLDALSRLPEKQRIAVTLRYVQDLPYAQIAAATGWQENTARTRVRRGLASLRRYLEPEHQRHEEEK